MTSPSPWTRIKNAHLFRVLVIYAAASWVLLQIVGLFIETMDLPRWTMPWTLVLLLAGLIVVLVTTWVQSDPSMPAREAADEVPGDWEVDVGEIKEAVSEGRLPHLNWARVILGGAVAFSLLFGLAGLYVVVKDRGRSFSPPEAMAEAAAPGIAVLPFEVSGSELGEWREGMVTLLSTALDGAGDLRAIDSRTLLARWDRHVPAGQRADRAAALEVARATGARYALLGSAVEIGENLRLVAEVYAVDDGAHLGSAQVEGAPDSVFGLVDGLARETLGVILEEGEGELPQVNLAALTTTSIPALKAFLEGEALFRRGEIEPAIAEYQAAVDGDSTFAMAWNRLGTASGWLDGGTPRTFEFRQRAYQHADRLPERERLLIEGELLLNLGFSEGAERMREATRRYPDDAEAWFLLADFYYHHVTALATLDDAEEAALQAVELDPLFAPYRFHPTEFAFMNPPDSVRAAERVAELQRASPEGLDARAGALALRLAFGDSARRGALMDSLKSADPDAMRQTFSYLRHPRFWEIQERVIEFRGGSPFRLFRENLLKRGRLAGALEHVDDPGGPPWFPSCTLVDVTSLGVPIPEDVLDEHLALRAADSTPGFRTACGGIYAVDRGRRDDHARALGLHRREAARLLAEGDTLQVRFHNGLIRSLEGYARWKGGDPAGALPLLQESARTLNFDALVIWMGQIHLELGRPEEAARHLRSLDNNPLADYHLGVAYERAGEYAKASEAYESLVEYWQDADPELQPMVNEARQALIQLKGLRRE